MALKVKMRLKLKSTFDADAELLQGGVRGRGLFSSRALSQGLDRPEVLAKFSIFCEYQKNLSDMKPLFSWAILGRFLVFHGEASQRGRPGGQGSFPGWMSELAGHPRCVGKRKRACGMCNENISSLRGQVSRALK